MRIKNMKKLLAVVVGFFAVAAMQFAVAQEERKGGPVEFYGCHWQDGKGMADLVKVGKKFSDWADKQDSKYSAWILTPQFHTDVGFDVGWLGGWPDGAEMGKSLDSWKSGGQELAEDFNAVISCNNRHELATAVPIHAPDGAPGGDGIVMFAGCSLADGKMGADAIAAHTKAGEMMRGKGAKATSSWVFFPGIGAGDYDFDYWQVITFNNYAGFGATSDIYINGGGWQEAMKIMAGVTQCGGSVMFDATVVRYVSPG
jgi:hypothetical protein